MFRLAVAEFVGFREVAGFHLNDCIEYFTAIFWPPLPLWTLDGYRSLQPRKNMNYDLVSQSRY